eukprot:PhF_6_TR2192/c0_g1_i2/m.3627
MNNCVKRSKHTNNGLRSWLETTNTAEIKLKESVNDVLRIWRKRRCLIRLLFIPYDLAFRNTLRMDGPYLTLSAGFVKRYTAFRTISSIWRNKIKKCLLHCQLSRMQRSHHRITHHRRSTSTPPTSWTCRDLFSPNNFEVTTPNKLDL